MYQQNKSSESKVKFRQTCNHCKRVLEAAKLAYATKAKHSITSQKLGSGYFWQIANSVLNKGKSDIPPLFNIMEVLFSTSDKRRWIATNFSKNSNCDSSKVSGPDGIPVVVLKNCEPELSHILVELVNMCLKETCFPDCLKV